MQKLKLALLILITILSNKAFCKDFNVKEYGAIGNGKTNDRVAIQTAIDNAVVYSMSHNNERTVVYFPNGKYCLKDIPTEFTHPVLKNKINNPYNSLLNIYSNLELVGNRHSILIAGEKLNRDLPCQSFNIIYAVQSINNFFIHRLTFDLNGSENMLTDEKCLQKTKNAAFCLTRGRKIKIDSITIRNSIGRQCISIGNVAKDNIRLVKNVVISNCVIENIGDCFKHEVKKNDHSSIYVMADSVEIFNNNLLCGGAPSTFSTAIECHLSNSNVFHNSINNYNIAFNVVALAFDQENVKYYENEIRNCKKGFLIWTNNEYKMKHIEIINNKANLFAYENYGFIYQVDKTNGSIDEISITNNEVTNSSNVNANSYPAIFFTGVSKLNISRNTFINYAKGIVYVKFLRSNEGEITNNVVKLNPNNFICSETDFNSKVIIRNENSVSLYNNCTY